MSFFFQACFEPQIQDQGFQYQKQYDPKVDLLPPQQSTYKSKTRQQQPKQTSIANKLRARGNFDRQHFQKDYQTLTLKNQQYKQFLAKKKMTQSMWGMTFQEYSSK